MSKKAYFFMFLSQYAGLDFYYSIVAGKACGVRELAWSTSLPPKNSMIQFALDANVKSGDTAANIVWRVILEVIFTFEALWSTSRVTRDLIKKSRFLTWQEIDSKKGCSFRSLSNILWSKHHSYHQLVNMLKYVSFAKSWKKRLPFSGKGFE